RVSPECPRERSFVLHDVGSNLEAVLVERPQNERGVEGIVLHQQGAELGLGFSGVLFSELSRGAAHCACFAACHPFATGGCLVTSQYSPSNFTILRNSSKSTGFCT